MRSETAGSVHGKRGASEKQSGSKSWEKTTTSISIPELDQQSAAIAIHVFYERIRVIKFEDAIGELYGFFQLIRHNPHFKREIAAIRSLIDAEAVINKFDAKVQKF